MHRPNPTAANILRTSPLSKDRPNRILFYKGSFNPPHISHLQVVRHALESSPDLNIVAAVIYMTDNYSVREKNQRSGRSLLLTNKERATLWSRDSRVPACAWVCDSPALISKLKNDLVGKARKKGLELCFVRLIGPDGWNTNSPPTRDDWHEDEFLISDAGRKADWYVGEGPPQKATGYTAWERVYPTTTRTKRQTEQDKKSGSKSSNGSSESSDDSSESSDDSSESSNGSSESSNGSSVSCDSASEKPISSASDLDNDADNEDSTALKVHEDVFWECRLQSGRKIKVRFLSKRPHSKIKSCSDDCEISSTAIYRIIADSSQESLQAKLDDLALSPDLLSKYLENSWSEIRGPASGERYRCLKRKRT